MGKNLLEPLSEVDFRCEVCSEKFTCAPDLVEDDDSRPWHPWFYTNPCPVCRGVSEQDPRQRGLLKAWAHATGPTSPEGRAKSAANLEGHPTPEEAQITRMNSMKHGLYANRLSVFPARPGKYPSCEVCDYFNDICIPNPPSYHDNPPGCLKKAEVLLRHKIAFQSGDPGLLTESRAETQASIQLIIDEMILQIAQDGGPRIMELKWYHDKDGGFHLARYRDEKTDKWVQVYEAKAHVLLKPLIDFISKNSLTLSDMGMTPKVQQENDLLAGNLQNERQGQQDAIAFRENQQQLQQQLIEQIKRSQSRLKNDPVLIEHNQGDADG